MADFQVELQYNDAIGKWDLIGRRHCGNGNDACYGQFFEFDAGVREAVARFGRYGFRLIMDFPRELSEQE